MSKIRTRLSRLEKRINTKMRPLPYVVSQREGESEEEAILRTYGEMLPEQSIHFVLAPETMSNSAWEDKYSPPKL